MLTLWRKGVEKDTITFEDPPLLMGTHEELTMPTKAIYKFSATQWNFFDLFSGIEKKS